jgi:hypothetical protein
MTEFQGFFQLGFEHILDLKDSNSIWKGIDHILFIVVLSTVYQLREWRKILILVTAFTIGHSLTLILAAMNVIGFNPKLIEILIPITILITAIINLLEKPAAISHSPRLIQYRYALAIVFGLVHGFAFSNSPKNIFALSREGIAWKLFAFNLGIEVGQILVVLLILILSFLINQDSIKKQMIWNKIISFLACIAAVWLFYQKIME